MVKDLIKFGNRGRTTYVSLAGIEVGKALKGISFDQSVENINNPTITATIDIREMLRVLSEVTPEQLEEAKEIIKPYLAGYRKDDAGEHDCQYEENGRSVQKAMLPCACGNVLHRKDAVYCSRCGGLLLRNPVLPCE